MKLIQPLSLTGLAKAITGLIVAGSLLGSCDFILPNKPPYIEKLSPADSSVFTLGEPIEFKVHAYDVDGSLIRVQFMVPGGETFNDPDPPYEYTWNTAGYEPGDYIFKIRALDDKDEHYLISVPITLAKGVEAFAGSDTTLFSADTTVILNALLPAGSAGTWSIQSGGDGSFSNVSDPKAGFTGMACKTYILRWTIKDNHSEDFDEVVVRFFHKPSDAKAGADQYFTDGRTLAVMNAAPPLSGNGKWTVFSGNGGMFTNPENPATTFNGQSCINYKLVWTVSTSCASTSDTTEVFFMQGSLDARAGADQVFSDGRTTTTLQGNVPTEGTGTWTIIAGTGGQINNPVDPHSTFSGEVCGTYQLRWTVSTSCGSSYDDVNITFGFIPSNADAGYDQSFIDGRNRITLNALEPDAGTGTWSIVSGGTGVFSNPGDPFAIFTGTVCQTYVLRWTISTPCSSDSDEVRIEFGDKPTPASAGPDQVITTGYTITDLAGNTPLHGTGLWTVVSGGTGTFGNNSQGHTTFLGEPCKIYILRWTISTNCESSSDEVRIEFNQSLYQANAGPDKKLTNGSISVTLEGNAQGPMMEGTWTIVSGEDGMFINNHLNNTVFNGKLGGIYLLRWAISNDCGETSDQVWISFLSAGTFADSRNGKTYKIMQIGNQTWMAENLNFPMSGAWPYNSREEFPPDYGLLYNYSSAMLACPDGWHLPTDPEWRQLEKALGMNEATTLLESWRGQEEGGLLKEKGLTWWQSPNSGANDMAGFSARPGGYRNEQGIFSGMGVQAGFWSSTNNGANLAISRTLHKDKSQAGRDWSNTSYGLSVRCLKN